MQTAMTGYFKQFRDLRVMVKNVFVSSDGAKAAIEWDWDVTRQRDGTRAVRHDAIIIDLVGGKIASWREYFDFGNSVDANPELRQRFNAASDWARRPPKTCLLPDVQLWPPTTVCWFTQKETDGGSEASLVKVKTLIAYNPSTNEIFLGFTDMFGYFNEVDFVAGQAMLALPILIPLADLLHVSRQVVMLVF